VLQHVLHDANHAVVLGCRVLAQWEVEQGQHLPPNAMQQGNLIGSSGSGLICSKWKIGFSSLQHQLVVSPEVY
jgi:hypothetical protein